MKMSPLFVKAKSNMQPGVITKDGFLGTDSRQLIDIIEADEKKIKSINLDIDILTDKMNYFLKEGQKGLGEPITIDKKWLVKVTESRGKLPCPFEDGIFGKINVEIENLSNKEKCNYSQLSIHLIKKHIFFQGKNTFFRLEPEVLKRLFEI